ncbi:L-serine dehydratase/L-threonine deaminase-like [Babylonia areolata]|uniref:L-serine dehydratase/L-threonine deaminase-like n=1 Tax=Babylonia areolata TaxID=304850 RepID=UPI003FD1B5EC
MMSEGSTSLYLKTPVVHSGAMSRLGSFNVFLKLDNLQPPGSFKIRGISNMCQKAIKERHCSHIYCASGGNAGLATAYVCQQLGMPCTIVLPESTPSFTADKLRDLGAEVEICGKVWDEANQYALEQSKKPGCEYVHPFDHPDIWEGHESIITESATQLGKKPDVVVTCVGGGGLLNGVLQGMSRAGWEDVPVVAMETEGADCLNQSIEAGKIVKLPGISSIAKSLGACVVSTKTFEYYNSGRYTILSEKVTDKDVVNACLRFADDHRFIVEPACGASLAAVYSGVVQRLQESGRLPKSLSSVLVVVCGGAVVNLDQLHKWREQFGL